MKDNLTNDEYIAAARKQYCDDEISIDKDPAISLSDGEGGCWVAAWVWVSNPYKE